MGGDLDIEGGTPSSHYSEASMGALQVGRLPLRSAAGWAAASGVLYALAQPSWGVWPLAPLCLIPLLRALARQPSRTRALLGWVTGSVATLLSTVVPATVGSTAYFEVPLWMGVVIALSVGQLFGAGTFALASVLAGDPARYGPASTAGRVSVAWVSAEFARATLLTGLLKCAKCGDGMTLSTGKGGRYRFSIGRLQPALVDKEEILREHSISKTERIRRKHRFHGI